MSTNTTALALRADWEDMVFADREQQYGAYQLRKRYPLHLTIGLLLVSFLAISAVAGPAIYQHYWGEPILLPQANQEVILTLEKLDPPPVIEEKEEPFIPPELPEPPKVKTLAANIPLPTPTDELDEQDATINEMDSLVKAPNIAFDDQDGLDMESPFIGDEINTDIPAIFTEPEMPKPGDFVIAEEEPKPVNLQDVSKLIGYPQIARDAGIQGTVVVRVLVDKRGKYREHKLINSAHVILDRAVQKELDKLQFTPAIQGGKPIPFWVNIPFRFSLMR